MTLNGYLSAAQEAAQAAGKVLKANLGTLQKIAYKGAVDIVTDVDRLSQETVYNALGTRFPTHSFLAEEDLNDNRGSEFCWIIDPLDGTTNYTHSFPFFCVSIALQKNNEIVVGVVYDPMRDEMFSAVKGKGATLNGNRIRVSSVEELDKSLLSTGFPYDIRESRENNLQHFSNFAIRTQAVRRCGSAAIDLCYVACGRFDGFWEMKLNPWDVAAGVVIVEEAGGRTSDFRGEKVDVFGKEVVASNDRIHMQMIKVLQVDK